MPDFDIYSRLDYFKDLIRRARAAGPADNFIVMAMVFDANQPIVGRLLHELSRAAGRGATVTAIVDAMTFMTDGSLQPGPLLTGRDIRPGRLQTAYHRRYAALEQLRAAGGSYHIINRPRRRLSVPYAGRSHIKLALVNDRVYIGGCNFDDPDNLDLMLGWNDFRVSGELRRLLGTVTTAGSVRQALQGADQTISVDRQVDLLIDAGVQRQSHILQAAHQLIDEAAERIMITCQYFPGGATAQRLLAAHRRGVTVTIYYSHPASQRYHAVGHWFYAKREQLRLPASFFANRLPRSVPKLHAKVLASESAVLVGSHNYVQPGVNFGTAETALLIHDRQASSDVRQAITATINAALAKKPR